MSVFLAVFEREVRGALRRGQESFLGFLFFALAVVFFPLALPMDAALLAVVGGGVVWVAALLSMFLAAETLFAADLASGVLHRLALAALPLEAVLGAKFLACWLLGGLPLALAAPLCAVIYGFDIETVVVCILALGVGTLLLTLIAGAVSALVAGARRRSTLLAVVAWPLCLPVLVFGAGAVSAARQGLDASTPLLVLAGLLLVLAAPLLWLAASALRSALAEN